MNEPDTKKKLTKSCALARFLSILLPGLGSVYTGEYVKGILWMIPGLFIIAFTLSAPRILLIFLYFFWSVYSSREASYDAAQFNARQALMK